MSSDNDETCKQTSTDRSGSMILSHSQQGNDHFHSTENQDRMCFSFDEKRCILWLGVFDGHSGSDAAEFLCNNLLKNINDTLDGCTKITSTALEAAMRSGIAVTERQFKDHPRHGDGSCVLLVCIFDNQILSVNIGDSILIIGQDNLGETSSLRTFTPTHEHNVSNPIEANRARLRFLQGVGAISGSKTMEDFSEEQLVTLIKDVLEGDTLIAQGRLLTTELTRSFGDFGIKRASYNALTSEPEFNLYSIQKADRLLLLASDGVYSHISTTELVNMTYSNFKNLSASYGQNIAELIIEQSVQAGSGDDQSLIILDLDHYRDCISTEGTFQATKFHPLLESITQGLFVACKKADVDNRVTTAAVRSWEAKLAHLHRSNSFLSSSDSPRFEKNAAEYQKDASVAHRWTKSDMGKVQIKISGHSELSKFDMNCLRNSKKAAKEKRTRQEALGTRISRTV